MSSMNFQLVLELIDKASGAMKKIEAAEKAVAATTKANNEAAQKGAQKAEAAIKAENKALERMVAANKALADAARARAAAEATAAQQTAQAQGQANQVAERSLSVFQRLRAGAASAASAVTASFQRASSAVAGALTGAARKVGPAGKFVAKEFAKGFADGVKSTVIPMLGDLFKSTLGLGVMSGPGAFRARVGLLTQEAIIRSRVAASAATAMAYSNVQGAFNVDQQLRPDLGEGGARAYRAAADAYLLKSPFRRDDIRAALPDAAKSGLMPGSGAWNALMDAAVASGQNPAQAVAAWAAMKRGDYSGLAGFGLDVKTDDNGKATGLAYNAGGQQRSVAVAGDIDAKVQAALDARFAGAGDRKSMSLEGMTVRAQNAWDSFVGKVMDSGPYDFVLGKFQEIFGALDQAGGSNGAAEKFGRDLTAAMQGAYDVGKDAVKAFSQVKSALDPVVESFGGWKNAIEGAAIALGVLKGLGIASAIIGSLGPVKDLTLWLWGAVGAESALASVSIGAALASMGSAMASAARAVWLFNAALLANPITWIVVGVLAFAAAAYLVWQNWDKVGPALERAWTAISTAIGTGLDAVTQKLSAWGGAALSAVQTALQPVEDWISGLGARIAAAWDRVKAGAQAIKNFVTGGSGEPTDKAQAAIDAGQAAEQARASLEACQAALNTLKAAVAGVSFHAEGVAMMRTLAAGIEAGAGAAVAAVAKVTQQIRDHLPHSPAKVGPLSDLDRVRFSETLAASIRPGPAIDAVRSMAAAMRAEIPQPEIGVLARHRSGASGGAGGAAGAAGGPISIHYAPTIHVGAGAGGHGDFADKLRAHAHELGQIVNERLRSKNRLSFTDV